jgi:hypothetical protein
LPLKSAMILYAPVGTFMWRVCGAILSLMPELNYLAASKGPLIGDQGIMLGTFDHHALQPIVEGIQQRAGEPSREARAYSRFFVFDGLERAMSGAPGPRQR